MHYLITPPTYARRGQGPARIKHLLTQYHMTQILFKLTARDNITPPCAESTVIPRQHLKLVQK